MHYTDAMMDTRFAAAYLGYSPATLRLWRRKGCGPKFQYLGRFVEYLRQDLDTWSGGHEASALRRAARRAKFSSIRWRGSRPGKPATPSLVETMS